MLFNSYAFLFGFLPACLAGYFLTVRVLGRTAGIGVLVLASLVFYGWWNPLYLPILLLSIGVNGALAVGLVVWCRGRLFRIMLLACGLAFNLGLLGYFKYAAFAAETINALLGTALPVTPHELPLGISFFTFQKIAFLVDAYAGLVVGFDLLSYALFVTFFPQLIAGPIVHYREVSPQFRALPLSPRAADFAVGLSIFSLGLFSKCVLADGLAEWATPVFAAAAAGKRVSFAEAWVGALAYTFQLYFDFAGYSNMAIGLARLFGVVLPVNFLSPYRAVNIIDFWRRWHITLSRFLRDYVYIPLGGNRRGPLRRYVNVGLTMLVGGLWHGAAWTFVLWGALHGIMLLVNHAWRDARARLGVPARRTGFGRGVGWLVTFIAVVTAWVPFRAPTLGAAMAMWQAMYTMDAAAWTTASDYVAQQAVLVGNCQLGRSSLAYLLFAALVAFAAPNVAQLFADRRERPAGLRWSPNAAWAALVATLAVAAVLQLGKPAPFLYFQF